MSSEKPHKGIITNWFTLPVGSVGLGYVICGHVEGHPEWGNGGIRTSYVIAHDAATGEIETRNSRYTLR